MLRSFTMVLAGAVLGVTASGDDWPQWLGPQRDSVWRETQIVERFPEGGPPVRWRTPIHGGYAGPAVAAGRVFVTDYKVESGDTTVGPSIRNEIKGAERVLCLDAESGKLLWEYAYPSTYHISYPAGPRSTPTVDGDRVYTLGAEGHLACLDVNDGKPRWAFDLNEKFACDTPYWGFASHPLVDGDRLCLVAGGDGSVAVALDKRTGEVVWQSLSAREPGYGSPTLIEAAGRRQLLIWHPESVNALVPETGEVLWSFPLDADYGMSINVPRLVGDRLFVGGHDHKSVLLQLTADPPGVRELWRGTRQLGIGPVHSPPVIVDDTLYGVATRGELTAVDLASGTHLWETCAPTTGGEPQHSGTGFLVRQGERFFIFGETGDLVIAELARDGYREIDRAHLIEPTQTSTGRQVIWSHPAYANRCVYLRNDKEIVCVSLAAEG